MTHSFDDDQLRAAYAPGKRRGPDCPSPEALLAAVRGEGAGAERLRVLDHALQCESCRPELALLHAVSEPAAAKSQGLGPLVRRRAIPLALAASVLLAFGVARIFRPTNEAVRSGTSDVVLLAPENGSAVGDDLTFVWRPVARARYYTLEVSDIDGTILSMARTTDTVAPGPSTPLPPGEHRWWIRAHLDDGTERQSETRVIKSP